MSNINPSINESWKKVLSSEFNTPYFEELKQFLVEEKKSYTIYPKGDDIFRAFNTTPFDKVKVVILGQDPYHGDGQAHGLSFSVKKGVKLPPSLKNIYKELKEDVDFEIPEHGELLSWAEQGVLLLNATLTVRAKQAGSHQKKGWEQFTDAAIKALNDNKEKIVFILWGRYAQDKGRFINREKHFVLESAHPSPFSAYNGFFGCKHFSKTNDYLSQNGLNCINWQIK